MKYLVHKDTKEHIRYSPGAASCGGEFWNIVEADDEGWIPWSGGECPLPISCEVETKRLDGKIIGTGLAMHRAWPSVSAYRPILSETAEKEEPRRPGRTIAYIPETPATVFDRLKSAIAASESIPGIIAEIDALLPDGYCVAKRSAVNGVHIEGIGGVMLTAQPAEDMSDWRNWRDGDLVECVSDEGWEVFLAGGVYEFSTSKTWHGLTVAGQVVSPSYAEDFRFHSRPAKVAA